MSFKMKIDLSSTQIVNANAKKELETGVYQGKINKLQGRNLDSQGYPTRGLFVIEVTEGDFAGLTCLTSMKVATSPSDPVAKYWKTCLTSCGYDQDEIADIVEYEEFHFVGKNCFIKYTHKNDNGGQYDRVQWLTPEGYEVAIEIMEDEKIHQKALKEEKAQVAVPKKEEQKTTEIKSPKISKVTPPSSIGDLNNLMDSDMPF